MTQSPLELAIPGKCTCVLGRLRISSGEHSMLQSINLNNFKCFERQDVALKPLTLLAGVNSSGKSTIIQSLLLIRQSFMDNVLPQTGLTLNGRLVQLGTARDVLFEESDVDEIGLR